jgi:hypothetical protein
MARLTLSPVNMPGTQGMVLSATAGAQSLGSSTIGVQFTNNGEMFLAVYVGSSGACNFTQNFGRTIEGAIAAPVVVALADSTNYLFGPWSPSDFTAQDGSGLTYFDFSVLTGNSVTLYQLVPVS